MRSELEQKVLDEYVKTLTVRTQTALEICPVCEGKGFSEKEKLIDYHKRDYATFTTRCEKCDASGKIVLQTVKVYNNFSNKDKHIETRPASIKDIEKYIETNGQITF